MRTSQILAELTAKPWRTSGEVAHAIDYDERACSALMGQMKTKLRRRKMFDHPYRAWCWVYAVRS